MKENKSGVNPKGHAVLIRPLAVAKKSIIAIPESYKDRQALLETRGEVVAIGGDCWADEQEPRAKVGDIVMTPKFCGNMIEGPLDGVLYRLVNDNDIFCTIEENSHG